MLSAVAVSFSRGGSPILDKVSISIGPQSRWGIVGPNGVGKSTLLQVLVGVLVPDAGRVERSPAGLTVGYLPQESDAVAGETLLAYLSRRTGVTAASDELDHATTHMADDPNETNVDAYTDALERFLALGGDDLEARAGAVCADVGLPEDRLGVEVGVLSGGQAARAALAAILLARFDVFLLDEPTNNLDFAGLERLERFLGSLSGAVVVVSHDRFFLDRTVSRILELDEHSRSGREFAGTWSDFIAARDLARAQQAERYADYTAARSRLTARVRTQKEWAVVGVTKAKKNPKDNDKAQRDFRKNNTEKMASKVKISEKAIERLEVVEKPWEPWELRLSLGSDTARSGDVVARLEGAVVERGTFRLGPVDVEIGWAERIAILGPNGSGKSTLLGAILGRFPLAAGQRYLGPGVVVGELDQARSLYDGDTTLFEAFTARTGMDRSDARSLLAKFALGSEHVSRSGGALSPGERTRAVLATLMAGGVNCLVLDEPTNHLDLEAIEQLEIALDGFAGTVLLVTHDRALLEGVEITRTIEVGETSTERVA